MRASTLALIVVPLLASLLLLVPPSPVRSEEGHNTPIYTEQGGANQVVGDGGTVTVQSGGAINVEAGGTLGLTGNTSLSSGCVLAANSGSTIQVQSGGILALASGAKFTLAVETVSTTTTVTAAKSGTTYISSAADVDWVLPAAATGLRYTFIVGAASSGDGARIIPGAGDNIIGNNVSLGDAVKLQNTGATDEVGNTVSVVADASGNWYITSVQGEWVED